MGIAMQMKFVIWKGVFGYRQDLLILPEKANLRKPVKQKTHTETKTVEHLDLLTG